MKSIVYGEMNRGIDCCRQVQEYYFQKYNSYAQKQLSDKNQNIKCAWNKNLGLSIIDYVDVYIGGVRIDRHHSIWMYIWYQLTYKQTQIDIYNKMIGNVDVLTNFDNQEKPVYDLFIPLTFWFNKYNGLSFPLIANQYNDIRFLVKLRRFEEVFHIERLYSAELNGSSVILTADMIDYLQNRAENTTQYQLTNIKFANNITLTDIFEEKGKQLDGHILMDYVFLESNERKKFAQSGHEYLIERIQMNDFTNIEQTSYDIQLDFVNPSKEIVWVMTKDIFKTNETGWNVCSFNNFSNNGKNPILNTKITFNNRTRVDKADSGWYDIYQPYTYHRVSPKTGINMYSFSLDPLQSQPTGACNFTRLPNVRMFMTIDESEYTYIDNDVYPYDTNINFTINFDDTNELIQIINIDYAKKIVKMAEHGLDNINVPLTQFLPLLDRANTTVEIYDLLSTGQISSMELDTYRKLIFNTKSSFNVFNLSINILRLIGGYGTLAYSGNT